MSYRLLNMNYLLLLPSMFLMQMGLAQSTFTDSLKNANIAFNNQIQDKVKTYEEEGYDFLILRIYDTLQPIKNRCHFMIRKDSCTQRFVLSIKQDFSFQQTYISHIDYYGRNSPCHDEIGQIEAGFNGSESYIKSQSIDSLRFEPPYTLYGKINKKYLYEVIDKEFVSKFHSGIIYDILCFYMGVC